jgi:hypothetical protein
MRLKNVPIIKVIIFCDRYVVLPFIIVFNFYTPPLIYHSPSSSIRKNPGNSSEAVRIACERLCARREQMAPVGMVQRQERSGGRMSPVWCGWD